MEAGLFLRRALRRLRDIPLRSLAVAVAAASAAFVLLLALAWWRCGFDGCPDVSRLASYQPGGAPLLLDRQGEVFADLAPPEPVIVPLHALPSHVPQAFLAIEDQRFYEHDGVDWRRIGGAAVANLRAGGFEQGFSTITMQLARNVFPDRIPARERTTSRKLLEVRVAKEIEAEYSKDEILEMYLNHIYFGSGAHGVEVAAQSYFGRPAAELTLAQAALLAALPKAPSHYDPRRRPRAALERRNLVLALMERQGRIPRFAAEAARAEPLGVVRRRPEERVKASLAPYFVEQVRVELEERFGEGLYAQPLRIWTTLDSAVQRAADEELARQLRAIEDGELGRFEGDGYAPDAEPSENGTSYLQGAVVAIDPRRGDVLAWVGGRDFAHSQFDRVAMAQRQVGSAWKPFVYAAALARGWALSQPLSDRRLTLRMADGQVWQPKNFSDRYEGPMPLREALVRSQNVPTVRLASEVGFGAVADLAERAGIEGPISEYPAMALGAVSASPLELATAYTPFANGGIMVEPRLVQRVEDQDGKVLWEPGVARREVVEPPVAYLVTDVLAEALGQGTAAGALPAGFAVPAAGKTGTTNAGTDAWFVGYTPDLVAAVWIGFDRPRPIVEQASGGRLAAPVWGRLAGRVYSRREPPEPWEMPEQVVARQVDPATGLVIAEGCAHGGGRRELFIEGMEPAAFCPGEEPAPREGFYTVVAARRAERAEREQEARDEQAARQRAAQRERERRAAEERLVRERREEREEGERRTEAKRREEREEERAKEREKEETERRAAAERREEREEDEARAAAERRAAADDDAAAERTDEDSDDSEDVEESEEDEEDIEPAAEPAGVDLSGWWELSNRIESTSYAAYEGLRLGYRLRLEQHGDRLSGRGQKWSENGAAVPAARRSPIRVTGTIDGRTVTLEFTEEGARRASGGTFTWSLSPDGTTLRGSFASDAADTSGSSLARRMP